MVEELDDLLGDDDLSSFFENEDPKNEEEDLLSSFFAEDAASEEEGNDLAAFLNEETEGEEEDLLSSFFAEDVASEEEGNDLAAFLNEETEGEEEDLLSSFFAEDAASEEDSDLAAFLNEEEPNEEEDLLASFLAEDTSEEAGEEEDDTGIFGAFLGEETEKPEALLPYKKEKRKAKVDITKNSKDDNTIVKRYTKRELDDQLKRDYKYMLGKPYMVIQPLTILADYPYKKKKSDSDIIGSKNVEYDYAMVIGKVLKWRSTEDFRGKAYKLGEIMYMKRGVYWIDGKKVEMEPHFAIVIHRSYKRIKSKRIRDLLAPLKQRLRSGKPFSIYKEFPVIIERKGAYS
ncbi:hypothetical protein [Aureispira anguillae]|uniref:Uncharacterized protein n=1 Tax=Aureispira anguillae TaxID=2864201 RepID=A0A915YLC4_9BACT|nr:hypothetical protein [Aureispira anguillae]BDS15052.1 hypothetical protein AsAng_0058340 [Aureispira anguillae]